MSQEGVFINHGFMSDEEYEQLLKDLIEGNEAAANGNSLPSSTMSPAVPKEDETVSEQAESTLSASQSETDSAVKELLEAHPELVWNEDLHDLNDSNDLLRDLLGPNPGFDASEAASIINELYESLPIIPDEL